MKDIRAKANSAKHELIKLLHELEEVGEVKAAAQLEKIIIKLEVWQNR